MKVAVLSQDSGTLRNVLDFLTAEDGALQVQTWPGGAAHIAPLVEQEHPDILVFESSGAHEQDLAALEKLTLRHPGTAVILLCAHPSPELLLRAMRVGVREVLPSPVTREALQQAAGRIRQRLTFAKTPERNGKVIALLPCKGGSGATFLATNLGYAIAAAGKKTFVVDLNLHLGEASLFVADDTPQTTVADVARQIQRLDSAFLEASMIKVTPTFGVLAAPDSPEQAVEVRPESVERLLAVARGGADYVILDVGRNLDAVSVKALDCADEIYLVLQLTLPFIRDAKRLLKLFNSLGYPMGKVRLLVNRFEKGGEIGLADVEKTLGLSIFKTVPNSFAAVAASINHGKPILDLAPRDPVAKALREIASQMVRGPQSGGGWLSSLLRTTD